MSQGLFTAVSGIRANQTKMNVISNNLANVNTIAFKASGVNFKTVFANTISQGTRPTSTIGGSNPQQIGNGVVVSEVPVNFAQGGTQFTGRSNDYNISGQGFFTVERIENGQTSFYLTRAGNFTLDADGFIVSGAGNRVQGTDVVDGNNPMTVVPLQIPRTLTIWKETDPTTNDVVATYLGTEGSVTVPAPSGANVMTEYDVQLLGYAMGRDGAISAQYSNGDRITVQTDGTGITRELLHITSEGFDFSTSGLAADGTLTMQDAGAITPQQIQLRMATVINPEGLVYEGNNNWSPGANSGDASFGIPNSSNRGPVESGALESSNVDIAKEFTDMIIAQRGLEASSKVVSAQNEVLRTIIGLI